MACNYLDLPPLYTPIPGKQMMKVDLRTTGADGDPEVVYSYVTPKSVHEAGISDAIDASGALEGRPANGLAFKRTVL